MKDKTIGFVGGGRVAQIILGGFKKAGVMPQSIIVSDTIRNIYRSKLEPLYNKLKN